MPGGDAELDANSLLLDHPPLHWSINDSGYKFMHGRLVGLSCQ